MHGRILCRGQRDAHAVIVGRLDGIDRLGTALVLEGVVLLFGHDHQFDISGFVGDVFARRSLNER